MRRIFLLVAVYLFFLFPSTVFAGDFPQNIRWYSLKGKDFTVIYPETAEEQARYTYGLLTHTVSEVTADMPGKLPHYPLVLSGSGIISNGFVTTGPRHSRFYLTHPQENFAGSGDWLTLLASHEMRHMAQFKQSRHGLNGFFSAVFGQYTEGTLSMLAVPLWLWEGDAVWSESRLTSGGRARVPEFTEALRGRILSDTAPDFDKAWLRQLDTPWMSHYTLGYLMHGYFVYKYGESFTASLYRDASWYSGYPWALERVLKNRTGLSLEDAYWKAMRHYTLLLRENKTEPTAAEHFTTKRHRFEYHYPRADGKNAIALRTSPDTLPAIVRIFYNKKRGEQTIAEMGSLFQYRFARADNLFAWIEYSPDARYGESSRSNVILYSEKTRKRSTVLRNARITSIDLSADGKKMLAVESSVNGRESLVMYNLETEPVQKIFHKVYIFPEHPRDPVFTSDNKSIVTLVNSPEGNRIDRINIETGVAENLLPVTHTLLSSPRDTDGKIFFTAGARAIDEIYSLNTETQKVVLEASRPVAAKQPFYDAASQKLFFIDTREDLQHISIASPAGIPAEIPKHPRTDPLFTKEEKRNFYETYYAKFRNRETATPPPERYHPLLHAVNFHSRSFFYDPVNQELSGGIYSSDIFGNLNQEILYTHRYPNNTDAISGTITFSAFYPVISVSGLYGTGSVSTDEKTMIRYDTGSATASLAVPVSGAAGRWHYFAAAQTDIARHSLWNSALPDSSLENSRVAIQGTYYKQMTSLDFVPRMGTALYASRSYDFAGATLLTDGSATMYLPGLFRTQGLFGGLSYAKHETDFLSSMVAPARGYIFAGNFSHVTIHANYVLPLGYPSADLWDWLYFRRILLLGFVDKSASLKTGFEYSTAGFDLIFDFKIFSTPIFLQPALRYAHRYADKLDEYAIVIYGAGFAF